MRLPRLVLAIALGLVTTAATAHPSAASTGAMCGFATPPSTYQHVIWIWFENHGYNSIVGSSSGALNENLGTVTQAAGASIGRP